MPGSPSTHPRSFEISPRADESEYSDQFQHVGYTCVWNIADWPAVTFPVLRGDSKIDKREESYTPRNAVDDHTWKQCTRIVHSRHRCSH